MGYIMRVCGPAGWGLLAVSLISLALIIRTVWRLGSGRGKTGSGREHDLNAILFWGGVAAVLGFMSQCASIYAALTLIIPAESISPEIIARGFTESFVPSFWGFGTLLVSTIAWLTLRLAYHQPKKESVRS